MAAVTVLNAYCIVVLLLLSLVEAFKVAGLVVLMSNVKCYEVLIISS